MALENSHLIPKVRWGTVGKYRHQKSAAAVDIFIPASHTMLVAWMPKSPFSALSLQAQFAVAVRCVAYINCTKVNFEKKNMVWHGLLWDIYALVCVSSGRQVEQEYLRISQDLSAEGRS